MAACGQGAGLLENSPIYFFLFHLKLKLKLRLAYTDSYHYIFQNDTVCLPSGLDCYANLTQENCKIPCKGIFADWTKESLKDFETNPGFQAVYEKYKSYKSGFKENEGRQLKTICI